MTPMTCWPALLTGLYRDYRELFTESGPFLFFSTSFLCLQTYGYYNVTQPDCYGKWQNDLAKTGAPAAP